MEFYSWLITKLGDTTVNSLLTVINTSISFKPLLEKFKSKSTLNEILISSILNSLNQQIRLTDSTEIKSDLTNVISILKRDPDLITNELEKIGYNFELLIKDDKTLREIAMNISEGMGYSDNPHIIGKHMGQALVNFFINTYIKELEPEQKDYLFLKNIASMLESIKYINSSLDDFKEESNNNHLNTHSKLDKLEQQLNQQHKIHSQELPIEGVRLKLKEWCLNYTQSQFNETLYDEKFTIFDIYVPLNAYTYKLKERFLDLPTLEQSHNIKEQEIYSILNELKSPGKPILIFASPGMGKSTFTKWLLVVENKNDNIPIRIDLKKFDFTGNFSSDLINFLNKFISIQIHPSFFSSLNIELILDGLDEIKLNSFEEHENFIKAILDFNDTYKNIKVILTSRISILNNRICDSLKNCHVIYIKPFSSTQIKNWIENWEKLNAIQINQNTNDFERDIFRQPLMLYLFFRMLREIPVESNESFKKLDIYRQLIEWTNGNEKFFTEDQLNLLSTFSINDSQLKSILKEFNENLSLAMLTNGKDTVSIEEVIHKNLLPSTISNTMLDKIDLDLIISKKKLSSILLIKTNTTFIQSFEIVDLFEFDFVHKSFKEYLASNAIVRKLIEIVNLGNEDFNTEIYKLFSTLKIIDNVKEFLFELITEIDEEILKNLFLKLNIFFSYELLPQKIIDSINKEFRKEIKLYFKDYNDITLRKIQCNLAECLITILSFLNDFLKLDNFELKGDKVSKLITIANSIEYEFRFEPLGTIDLENSNLKSISLNNANFDRLFLSESQIINADLSMSSFFDAGFQEAIISFSNLDHCNFTQANLYGSNISYTTLKEVDLSESILNNAKITYSDLSGANLENSDLSNCDFSYTNFNMANLGNCLLENTNFKNANLKGLIIDADSYKKYYDLLKRGENSEFIDVVSD